MPIRNSDGSVKKTTDRGYGWDHQKTLKALAPAWK